jgi:hypothetical protein
MCRINGKAFPDFSVPNPSLVLNKEWNRGFSSSSWVTAFALSRAFQAVKKCKEAP